MKNKTRTIELTIKTKETFIIRQPRQIPVNWCDRCGRETQMFKPEAAAQITNIALRTIYRLIESGDLGFTEFSENLSVICLACVNRLKPHD